MTHATERATRREEAAEGAVLVRNHDLSASHTIALRSYGPEGAVAYEATFRLDPGGRAVDAAALPAGSHTVEADCDAERYLVRTCELEEDDGLLVAVGNGVLDVAPRPRA